MRSCNDGPVEFISSRAAGDIFRIAFGGKGCCTIRKVDKVMGQAALDLR